MYKLYKFLYLWDLLSDNTKIKHYTSHDHLFHYITYYLLLRYLLNEYSIFNIIYKFLFSHLYQKIVNMEVSETVES